MTNKSNPYRGFRYTAEIIAHAVWLYHRFSLSFRDIEELLAGRGVTVTYETVRQWCMKFGQQYANNLRCGGLNHLAMRNVFYLLMVLSTICFE